MKLLTLDEICKELNRRPSAFTTNWCITQQRMRKKNIFVERYGTGKDAKFTVEYKVEED